MEKFIKWLIRIFAKDCILIKKSSHEKDCQKIEILSMKLNKLTSNRGDSIYKEIETRGGVIRIIKSPTKNCQWGSIFNSQILLNCDDIFVSKFLDTCCSYLSKKMILVDINSRYYDRIVELFSKNYIVNFKLKYKNSNASDMTLIMFSMNMKSLNKFSVNDDNAPLINRVMFGSFDRDYNL